MSDRRYSQLEIKQLYVLKYSTGINFASLLRSQRLHKIHSSSAMLFL